MMENVVLARLHSPPRDFPFTIWAVYSTVWKALWKYLIIVWEIPESIRKGRRFTFLTFKYNPEGLLYLWYTKAVWDVLPVQNHQNIFLSHVKRWKLFHTVVVCSLSWKCSAGITASPYEILHFQKTFFIFVLGFRRNISLIFGQQDDHFGTKLNFYALPRFFSDLLHCAIRPKSSPILSVCPSFEIFFPDKIEYWKVMMLAVFWRLQYCAHL